MIRPRTIVVSNVSSSLDRSLIWDNMRKLFTNKSETIFATNVAPLTLRAATWKTTFGLSMKRSRTIFAENVVMPLQTKQTWRGTKKLFTKRSEKLPVINVELHLHETSNWMHMLIEFIGKSRHQSQAELTVICVTNHWALVGGWNITRQWDMVNSKTDQVLWFQSYVLMVIYSRLIGLFLCTICSCPANLWNIML